MLYLVATPIGNLKDITLRALEILKECDVVACEDTRHSLKLLNHYEIKKQLISLHQHNENIACQKLAELVRQGKSVALITDAGMPGISDPGRVAVLHFIQQGLPYTIIPGASAFTSALVLSGIDSSGFIFLGFLPDNNKKMAQLFKQIKDIRQTLIFYCAPHDIKKNIQHLYNGLGERKFAAVKEITKIHETVTFSYLSQGIEDVKGEYVLVVEGAEEVENPLNQKSIKEHYEYYLESGLSKMDAMKAVAKERGISKSEIYKEIITND